MCSPQAVISEGLNAHSALWDAALRNVVTHSKMAAAELNQLRSRALVPGLSTYESLGRENVSHVPLVLVQRPGSQGMHFVVKLVNVTEIWFTVSRDV